MEKKILIRKAKVEDAEDIINHLKQILGESKFHTLTSEEFDKDVIKEEQEIEDYLSSKNSLMLICYYQNKLAGILTLKGGNRKRTKHFGVLGINFKNECCSLGLGTKLMMEMEKTVIEEKLLSKLNLEVHEKNIKAFNFYKKLGYKLEGVKKGFFYEDGTYYNSIIMGKSI
ncbi:MAG: GNAT family N-acetyltransferase [Fusobacteriaceae bacterium]|nr:GNAT family N-acetyltransferase [Fusobacteriaceae bacterium]MBN2838432.1 GNAT family N-acetyltransferase [Fusobacteriaceae bacterium]